MLNHHENSAATFPASPVARAPEKRIHELFEEQVFRTPATIAVEADGKGISYADLNAQADRLATELRALGVGANSRVAICATRSIEMVAAVLGILKAGAGYVALDPSYPVERLAYILQDSSPTAVVTHEALRSLLPVTGVPVICLDQPRAAPVQAAFTNAGGSGSDSLAYLLYTSGSTGQPKGVIMPHGPLVNLMAWQQRTLPLTPGDRVLQFAPLSFDVSFQEIATTLAEGGTLVLINDDLRRDPEGLLDCLIARKIHRLYLPFVALQGLAEAAVSTVRLPSTLKDIITAGEQLQVSDALRAFFKQLPGVRLHNHYGPTETHVVTAFTLPDDPATWPTLPPIGFPIDHTTLHLLDAERKPVAIGAVGELFISGAAVAQGYWNRDDLTKDRFLPDPLISGQRMYRTGDLAQVRPNGAVDFLGRADNQVKIRGHRVELGEVESALRKHAAIKDCAVAVLPHGNDKMLVAYLVLRQSPGPSAEELRPFLLTSLPEPMVPARYVPIENLPLTPSGKLDRRALPAPDLVAAPDSTPRTPFSNDLERTIAAAWTQAIGHTNFGATDVFFDAGGTSLLMAQVQRRLRSDLSRDLPITLLFQFPTIRQLAAQLSEKTTAVAAAAPSGITDRAALQREALAKRQAAMRPKKL